MFLSGIQIDDEQIALMEFLDSRLKHAGMTRASVNVENYGC
jgi:hypothetical protein